MEGVGGLWYGSLGTDRELAVTEAGWQVHGVP